MADTWKWSDLPSEEVRPRTDTVSLVLDGTIAAQLEDARARLAAEKRANDSLDGGDIDDLEAEVAMLEEAAAASTRKFSVHAVGYRRWRELVESHPPRDPMLEKWNPDFVPAAILECCGQFTSEGEVEQAMGKLAAGQVAKLFSRIKAINEGDDSVPTVRGR